MVIKDAIFIDYWNEEQLKWWYKKCRSKFVKNRLVGRVTDEETGKLCGAIYTIQGLFKNHIVKKGNSFIDYEQEIYFKK